MTWPKGILSTELQAAAILSDLTHFAYSTHGALVLRVVLASIVRTNFEGCTTVDRSVGCSTDIELRELIKIYLMRVVW